MRKNVLRTFIAAVLVGAMLVVPAYAEGATVTGSEVNLRAGPGTNYRIVDCLQSGAEVTVTDRSNGSWYAVEYNGVSGFMSSLYLSIAEHNSIVDIQAPASGSDGYINAMYVRFRSGPGSGYSILGEYNRGKVLTVTGSSGEWTACVIDGQAGYIYSSFISSGSAPSTGQSQQVDEYLGGFELNKNSQQEIPAPTATAAPTATPAPTVVPPQSIGDTGPDLGITEPPAVTAAPVPTQSPAATATPVPTASPTPTAAPVQTAEAQGYINGDYVRFRTGPSTSYSIIDSYSKGKTITITGASGDWTACTIDGQPGYVFSQYVVKIAAASPEATPTPTPAHGETAAPIETAAPQVTAAPIVNTQSTAGYINGNNVRMRSGASMNSEILGELFFGNAITITGVSGDWTAVTYNGTAGYVYSAYVKEGAYNYNDSTSNSGGTAAGQEIAQYALQFVGYNYSWGGSSPSTGFDCSGLVYYVYQHFGYTLNRVAADQAMNGVHVDSLEPGDILCFYSGNSYIGHSGIYIGDGKFVHAANSATGVIVTELAGYYTTRGYEARRVV